MSNTESPAFVDDGSKPCEECGETNFIFTETGEVCKTCGLVRNDERYEFHQNTRESPKFTKHKAVAKKVRVGSKRDLGSVIDLGIDSSLRNDPLARKLANAQKYTKIRINSTDVRNKTLLGILLAETEIDNVTANRARDTLANIIQSGKNEYLLKLSRKTSNSINLVLLGAIVSVIDERVNLESTRDERIVKWLIENSIHALDIDAKCHKTMDDVLERAEKRVSTPEQYVLILKRLESLEESKLDWIERIKKTTRSRFNKFRYVIDSNIDFLRNTEKKINTVLHQIGVTLYIDKIIKLVKHVDRTGLSIEHLCRACTAVVYSYYAKPIPFNYQTQKLEKYLKQVQRMCDFYIREKDKEMPEDFVADIIRPNIVILNRNEIWEDVFNDEYDRILEETLTFCEEIPRKDLEDVLAIMTERQRDIKYLQYILKKRGKEHLFDTLKIAPFIHLNDQNREIEYSAFVNDIEKEIKIFLRRGHATTQNGRTRIWIGKRRQGRDCRDEYSLNVLVKKKRGKGEWQHWMPLGEAKEIICLIFEQDAPFNASGLARQLVELGYMFECTKTVFTSSHKCKIYTVFQILRENMFLKKMGRGYATNAEVADALAFIDSVEVKHV